MNRKTINKTTCRTPSVNPHQLWAHYTAWKVSKKGVISGLYFSVFSTNTGKYGREITPYLDIFHAVLVGELLCWYDYLGFSDSFGKVSSIIFKFSTIFRKRNVNKTVELASSLQRKEIITVKTITICKLNFISFFFMKSLESKKKKLALKHQRPATLLKRVTGCFPMNFAKFLRTPFLQNTSGRLLLDKPDKRIVSN